MLNTHASGSVVVGPSLRARVLPASRVAAAASTLAAPSMASAANWSTWRNSRPMVPSKSVRALRTVESAQSLMGVVLLDVERVTPASET